MLKESGDAFTVEYKDWKKVDVFERAAGVPLKKKREKILDKEEMMAVA